MQRLKEKKRGKRNAEKSDEQNAKIFYHSLPQKDTLIKSQCFINNL